MTVGERIKTFRENKDITQTELAKAIDTTKQTIYKYENNIITNIPSDKIEKLSQVFEIDPTVLMGWDSEFLRIEQEIYKENARKILNDSSSTLNEKYNAKLSEYLCLYARSKKHANIGGITSHPDFPIYISMLLNQPYEQQRTDPRVYKLLVDNYGKTPGISRGTYWYPITPHDDVQTIAAHHDGETWTDEELDEIEQFKKYVLSKRKQ